MTAVRRSTPLVILALLAVAVALYFARTLLVPVVFALLLTAVFRPVVRVFRRLGLPAPASATIIVLGIVIALTTAVILLAQPARDWVRRGPEIMAQARGKLESIRRPVRQVTQAVEKMQADATGDSTGSDKPGQKPTAPPQAAAVGSVVGTVFGNVTALVGGFLETIVLFFLLLATNDLFQKKVATVLPDPTWGRPGDVLDKMESAARRYLVVTVMINAMQGVLVGLAMWAIGMPGPAVWGLLTFLFEFLPFLGAAFMMGMLLVAGFATFDRVGHALLAPGSYFAITTIQNNVVSPYAYGSGLRLNPVAVLLGVLLWYFLWGVPGAFVAVPLLAAAKIIADHSESWRRLGIVLGE